MTQVVCDNCKGKMMQKKPYDRKVKGDVRRVYIKCEHCGKEYTFFYTNTEMRKLQKEQQGLLSKRNTGKENEDKNLAEIRKNAKRISELMGELKSKYENI